MAVQITINQAGAPAGTAGVAREDLATGLAVVLTASGGAYLSYLWEVLDCAVDHIGLVKSAVGLATPNAATTNMLPIDLAGTYRVRVSVDSGSGLGATAADVATITFYAGPTLAALASALPRRIPAFGEMLEHNVPQAAGYGSTRNFRGWSPEMERWFLVLTGVYNAVVSLVAGGEWKTEDQAVAADGQTVFDVVLPITADGLLCTEVVFNGAVVHASQYAASNIAGHGRITYAPTGDSPATRAGWNVEVRYLH
jgi:hypothetical protein